MNRQLTSETVRVNYTSLRLEEASVGKKAIVLSGLKAGLTGVITVRISVFDILTVSARLIDVCSQDVVAADVVLLDEVFTRRQVAVLFS